MTLEHLANGGLRARLQLPDSPWLATLPPQFLRHANAPLPALAMPHPLAVFILLGAAAWAVAWWDHPHAFAFVRPEGVARRQHGQGLGAFVIAALPLIATVEWHLLRALRGRQVTLVAAKGQLVVATDGRRAPDVDAPLAACRLVREGCDLVVHGPDGVVRYRDVAAPQQVEGLIEAVSAVS